MAVYNFKRQFVPMILDLSKPHTIRRRRKHPTKIGDMLQMYVGLRTKAAFKFAESPCIDIQPILILPLEKRICFLNSDEWFSKDEIRRLAVRDGFGDRSAENWNAEDEFFHFFLKTYKGQFYLDDFEIIWWNVNQLKAMEARDANQN